MLVLRCLRRLPTPNKPALLLARLRLPFAQLRL